MPSRPPSGVILFETTRSHEAGSDFGGGGGDRTQILQNLSVFYDVCDKLHLGLETNYAVSIAGSSTLLLMPQFQVNFGSHLSVQMGAGIGFSESKNLPQAGLRAIWTF